MFRAQILANFLGELKVNVPKHALFNRLLVGYLRDGRFEIDSNLVENDVRPSAVGKRRWLFIGHPDAGWRSAVIYTIIQSCRRYGINPQDYLTDVLSHLPSMTNSQVRELLPGQWRKAHQGGGAAVQ